MRGGITKFSITKKRKEKKKIKIKMALYVSIRPALTSEKRGN